MFSFRVTPGVGNGIGDAAILDVAPVNFETDSARLGLDFVFTLAPFNVLLVGMTGGKMGAFDVPLLLLFCC